MPYHYLLVPTDGSELSDRAVAQAVALAAALTARLRILHVQSSFPISLVGVGELVEPSKLRSTTTTESRPSAGISTSTPAPDSSAVAVRCNVDSRTSDR
jgi:nucleotide-binding universal stress UspA family protein